ncbi:hypothetical protein N7645_25495 [Pseudomonas juntendi]|uniref:hypothetical protein n=1 Tax=Pseudomonas TaxID=286 RepID=UPI0006D3E0A7|nr:MULTISPECIES: hypothetical protein [Pseudomonas]MDG9890546.1 hypothetical protein [Pseudomonas juntendi]MDG9921407.1 hypothetical protein [Pseudomonas juntendi]MDH0509662.1 hypothetical protein [Pseudomonas juntendi]
MTEKRMTIHLDEGCIRDLEQLKRRIDAQGGEHAPVYSLPALARHAIRKWCDHVAAPMPRPWEQEQPSSNETSTEG